MVVHDHKPDCHAVKDWFANLHGHGHSEGSYNQNITISIETIITAQPDQVQTKQAYTVCKTVI